MPLSDPEARMLLAAARKARRNAYAPYSDHPVGAALLDAEGRVFTGANVENASFGLTICAERSAVSRAVSEGSRFFRAVAVVGPRDGRSCAPCGSCRQVLNEFGSGLIVVTDGRDGEPRLQKLRDLLPDAFGASDLLHSGGEKE